jgi:2-keto-4-pentenoate hydratase/2-oxohepta-3-ene-1,7-dioic acid hydratase in catechol pathway
MLGRVPPRVQLAAARAQAYQKPPLWMQPGDTIEVEITGIGVLRNPIVQQE